MILRHHQDAGVRLSIEGAQFKWVSFGWKSPHKVGQFWMVANTHTVLKPCCRALLLGHAVGALLQQAMGLTVRRTFKHRQGLSKPRKTRPKPYKFMALKPC